MGGNVGAPATHAIARAISEMYGLQVQYESRHHGRKKRADGHHRERFQDRAR